MAQYNAGYVHFRANTLRQVFEKSRKTCFGSKITSFPSWIVSNKQCWLRNLPRPSLQELGRCINQNLDHSCIPTPVHWKGCCCYEYPFRRPRGQVTLRGGKDNTWTGTYLLEIDPTWLVLALSGKKTTLGVNMFFYSRYVSYNAMSCFE